MAPIADDKDRPEEPKLLLWPFRFPPLLGGGLEPHFRVLFSAIFQGFPWGISIRVETGGSERKQKCGKLWSLYIQNFYVF
jgi:hypothetical protein